MQLDDIKDRRIVGEPFGESSGDHGMMVFTASGQIRIHLVLERVVNQSDEPQVVPVVRFWEKTVNVRQHRCDVGFDGSFGMSVARTSPFDSRLPCGIVPDPSLEIILKFKG